MVLIPTEGFRFWTNPVLPLHNHNHKNHILMEFFPPIFCVNLIYCICVHSQLPLISFLSLYSSKTDKRISKYIFFRYCNCVYSHIKGNVRINQFKGTVHSSNLWAKSLAYGSLMIVL